LQLASLKRLPYSAQHGRLPHELVQELRHLA
jgi:hypothetical protein